MQAQQWMMAAVLALGATAAAADCREDLAQLDSAKDGSAAPMQQGTTATPQVGGEGTAPAHGEAMATEGAETPLGTDPGLATSEQDVAAQQAGGATAAEQAAGAGAGGESREAVLARAEAALAAGDEAGCMAAVEQVKGM